MPARAIMLMGTCSNAGKSLLTAGLARAFARRGLRVRPFKPQNMSNNAAVTADGGEIGRAQALQARAAETAPTVAMNPVLLKPESETGAQLVVRGRAVGHYDARTYHALKPRLLPVVLESFRELEAEADLVLVEGAGSPAEINLRAGDIANMGFALAAGVPGILVGDIERGGVLAQIVGTVALLEAAERAALRGYIINKFRGDTTLFDDAHGVLEGRTGLTSLGVVPWCDAAAALPEEDVVGLDAVQPQVLGDTLVRIAVPRLPRIANFDDLDPLRAEPGVDVRILAPGTAVPGNTDLVLLLGSKATIADLAALRRAGWDGDILAHVRRGGHVLGLCGGYQMLGRTIADPAGIEGPAVTVAGLGLLAVDTVLAAEKSLGQVQAVAVDGGEPVTGYEIHLGRTDGPDARRAFLRRVGGQSDGAVSAHGLVAGCYLHGLFHADGFRRSFLERLRVDSSSSLAFEATIEAALDELARHLERSLDLDRLLALAAGPG